MSNGRYSGNELKAIDNVLTAACKIQQTIDTCKANLFLDPMVIRDDTDAVVAFVYPYDESVELTR